VSTATYPAHVFLDLHLECNLRCVQCDIYKLRNPTDELSLEERHDVIRQVANWHPAIRVVLTGGELFLRRRVLYDVAAMCATHGVNTTMNTNGTLVSDADVERLPTSGISCVVVSLDSDEAAVHDRIRGVPKTFERAVSTVRRLVAARDRAGQDFTVLTSTILGRHNLDRIESMLDFFEGLGVDTTLFQPLQPIFARAMTPSWWRTDPLFPNDSMQVGRAVDALQAARRRGRRVFQTESQFEDIRHYFGHPHAMPPGQCAAMDRHLMIDILGNVRLCFNMERIGLGPIGSVRETSLRALWEAEAVEATRGKMRGCAEGCGSMLCHAR
jgi:MoaA/NifB/PqqE/SkfB family radical SAM enzyme